MMKRTLVTLLYILPFIETAFPVQVIEAEEGDDVFLQCQQDAQVNLESSLVEWSKDGRTNIVHVYRHGRDYLDDQKEEFKGRTVLFHEGLSRGNVTLQLCSVRLSDNGRFRCYVRKLRTCFINLKVGKKVQSNRTQDDDLRTTRLPELTEPDDPDGKNTAAVLAGIISTVIVICFIGALYLIYRNNESCRRRLRRRRGQEAEMVPNDVQIENAAEGENLDMLIENSL